MPINIDTIKREVDFFAKKNRRGFINASEFNIAINRASREAFEQRSGFLNRYQPTRPIPPVAFDQTQKVEDQLTDFIDVKVMPVLQAGGYFPCPVGYSHMVEVEVQYASDKTNKKKCRFKGQVVPGTVIPKKVGLNQLNYKRTSQVAPPDYEFVFFAQDGPRGFLFLPSDVPNVLMRYLRYPNEAVWAFTIQNGREVYDPTLSVDLEWDISVKNDLVLRTLSYFGIHLKDEQLVQYSITEQERSI
jgi:hypothetical protein